MYNPSGFRVQAPKRVPFSEIDPGNNSLAPSFALIPRKDRSFGSASVPTFDQIQKEKLIILNKVMLKAGLKQSRSKDSTLSLSRNGL